jgi:hypothetical protein
MNVHIWFQAFHCPVDAMQSHCCSTACCPGWPDAELASRHRPVARLTISANHVGKQVQGPGG